MTNIEIVELLKKEYLESYKKLEKISNTFYEITNSDPMIWSILPRIEKIIAGLFDLDRDCNPVHFDCEVHDYLHNKHPLESIIEGWKK